METKANTEIKVEGAHGKLVEALFNVGAHYGQLRSRRHPSAKAYMFGVKEKVEIFDLEKTVAGILAAQDFLKKAISQGGKVVFVGSKPEARTAVLRVANATKQPYVAGRWLGGTFTNFPEMRKRVARLVTLRQERERGDLVKYTKRERMLIDKEIEHLEKYFAGLVTVTELPKAMIVIDAKREHIAVEEARKVGVPVISLSSSDCDFSKLSVAIPGNDASLATVNFVLDELAKAITA